MNRGVRLLCLLVILSWLSLLSLGGQTKEAVAAPDDPTIVGGQDVPDPNPYVWQVSLQLPTLEAFLGTTHWCGGSVIADKWILTAAHCLYIPDILLVSNPTGREIDICASENLDLLRNNLLIVVNRRVLSQKDPQGKDVLKVAACRHGDFDDFSKLNDIAVIELESAIVDASSFIIPLLTVDQETTLGAPGTLATVTGWGDLAEGSSIPVDVLQFVEVPILTNAVCNDAYGDIASSMVCAGPLEGGKDSCQGDSGGPLAVRNGGGGFALQGIVSFGRGCARPNFPGVYTRVSSFIDDNDFDKDWIVRNTGSGADLVIENLLVSANDVQVVIKNQGKAPVPANQGFWVDLYINPKQPLAANVTWEIAESEQGLVWGVDSTSEILAPGATLTLSINGAYYWPTLSKFSGAIAEDAEVFVQVDSANANTTYGGVRERHELLQAGYNNVAGPAVVASQGGVALVEKVYLPMITTGAAATVTAAQVDDRDLPLRSQ